MELQEVVAITVPGIPLLVVLNELVVSVSLLALNIEGLAEMVFFLWFLLVVLLLES